MKTVILERHRARDEKRRLHAFKRLVQDTGSTISECTTQKDVQLEEEQTTDSDEMPEKRLPLVINASILLIFCMLGGVLYIAAGGRATFIESFFLTFNLVANLTMSEMPNELNHILTIIYIFVFVTCGKFYRFLGPFKTGEKSKLKKKQYLVVDRDSVGT